MRALMTIVSLSFAAPVALADVPPPPYPDAGVPDAPHEDEEATPVADEAPAADAGVADAAPAIVELEVEDLPERCRPIAKRIEGPSAVQRMSARIALAGCLADVAIAPLSLIDGQESVVALDEAVGPAMALLDGVAQSKDAAMQIMALRAKADLFGTMIARMQRTVPRPKRSTFENDSLYDTRKKIVDGLVTPWRDRAREAHQAIVEIAEAHPELVRNPVATASIRESRRQLKSPVASR